MQKVIGLITCNYSAKATGPLAETRPIASMPFFGRYRLVDFPLSNLVNAGIRTVGMIMPYNYRSLVDHVESGKDWDLDRKNGGLFILPGSAFGTSRTGARFLLRDLVHNKVYFMRSTADYVIFSSANFVYNMDFEALYQAHVNSGADITVLTNVAPKANEDVVAFNVEGNRVTGIRNGVNFGDTAFLDTFIMSRSLLLDMFDWYAPTDYLDLFEPRERPDLQLRRLRRAHLQQEGLLRRQHGLPRPEGFRRGLPGRPLHQDEGPRHASREIRDRLARPELPHFLRLPHLRRRE